MFFFSGGKRCCLIIADRHPSPLFSVCITSLNTKRKTMQTQCMRKTGVVFFGVSEIIRGNLTHAKLTHSIIKPKPSCIIKNNAACFSFNACIYPLAKHFPPDFLLT